MSFKNYTMFQIQWKILNNKEVSERDILAVILSPGVKELPAELIADKMLEKFGNLRAVLNAPFDELCKMKGVGVKKAIMLKAIGKIKGE